MAAVTPLTKTSSIELGQWNAIPFKVTLLASNALKCSVQSLGDRSQVL